MATKYLIVNNIYFVASIIAVVTGSYCWIDQNNLVLMAMGLGSLIMTIIAHGGENIANSNYVRQGLNFFAAIIVIVVVVFLGVNHNYAWTDNKNIFNFMVGMLVSYLAHMLSSLC